MRVKYIDVLKAFAIIAVVLYHAGFMTYGYLGVDLFLVIGGYLTTNSLYNKVLKPSSGGISYVGFELSRIIRLLPVLLVAGIVCMSLGFLVMLPNDYENLSESVIATNFFANNILAAITTRNYWDVTNEFKPLMHTWYLGVLMQFYLLYPIAFYLARFDKKNPKGTLLTIISVIGVLSLLTYIGTADTSDRFYYLPSRFFEFAAGGIVALTYNSQTDKPFRITFVYICYALLLILMAYNIELIPSNIRLLLVVALSVVLLASRKTLENNISGNPLLSMIGAASLSIFIWHQIVFAFCRYFVTSRFVPMVFIILIAITGLLSWITYMFVEQKTTKMLKDKRNQMILYAATVVVFFVLNFYAAYIYMNAGVVRDIPELYVSTHDKHRGMHAEYVDRVRQYDKPFATTDKKHWYVIGNSFGRDFVNVILESPIADSVEVSYSYILDYKKEQDRFKNADVVFFANLGLTEDLVTEIEINCLANGLNREQLVIVGEKNFGVSNGQVYAKRNDPDYFNQYVDVEDIDRFIIQNKQYADKYGDRFIDMMSYVTNEKNQVRVFTPDHHFISADCRHLSKGGAIYYSQLINWKRFLCD